jgi:ABC-type multidrug transport system fused ATPase/permease subunit
VKNPFNFLLGETIVWRCFNILSKVDRAKIVAVVFIQLFFGLLDLVGVALIGILGALSITGIQSKTPGARVSSVLNFLNLDQSSLQTQVACIGIIAATVLISKTILSIIFSRKAIFFLARRSAKISAELIQKVLSQSLVQIHSRSMQQTLYSVTSGVESITMGILSSSLLIVSDLSLLVILAGGLFVVDPPVAISTFLVFTLVAILLYRLMQVRASYLGSLQRSLQISNSESILEVLSSFREITVKGRQGYYAEQIGKVRLQLADASAERTFMPNISKYVIEITFVVGSFLIAAVQFLINDAARAIAVLSVFIAASSRISPAILRLQQGALAIKSHIGIAAPTLTLIEELSKQPNQSSVINSFGSNHLGFPASVYVSNVSVTYKPSDIPAVKDISLEIKAGSIVAFVGPSGAGKTTLTDLILGVIEPDSGCIQIGDKSPKEAIQLWPGAIGYVPQDVMISNGTIRHNVILGFDSDSITEDEIWAAIGASQLTEFVHSLELGLDTPVGDRGAKLSGGQRQRLGIARALITKPRLLVLDEATSALDGTTEANLTDAILGLRGDVTVILIAHRLSTVKAADVIYYLSEGRMIANGNFAELRKFVPDFDKQARLMGL